MPELLLWVSVAWVAFVLLCGLVHLALVARRMTVRWLDWLGLAFAWAACIALYAVVAWALVEALA